MQKLCVQVCTDYFNFSLIGLQAYGPSVKLAAETERFSKSDRTKMCIWIVFWGILGGG